MNFLIDLFKKATKGDNFRTPVTIEKYDDAIAQLNALGSNQYSKISTNKISRLGKTKTALTQEVGNTTPPGTR
jgi:hypothetical protein